MDMVTNWRIDKTGADRFLPEIKQILGLHLIGESAPQEDAIYNTDLIVLKMDNVRIACRVRKYTYLDKYGNEFTIRRTRPSGNKSELTKIIEGWGDYFFYAFSDEKEERLLRWFLCDLNVFRLWFNRELVARRGNVPGIQKTNKDNSSDFLAFKYKELPKEFIVASHIWGGDIHHNLKISS